MKMPDLTPVVFPVRLKTSQGKQTVAPTPQISTSTTNQTPKTEHHSSHNTDDSSRTVAHASTDSILASIDPPSMVRDPNPTNQLNPSTYTPVQPFILPQSNDSKSPIPPHLNPLPLVNVAQACDELTKRMIKGPSTLPSEQRSLRTVKDEEDMTSDVVEKKIENTNDSGATLDEAGDDDPQDEVGYGSVIAWLGLSLYLWDHRIMCLDPTRMRVSMTLLWKMRQIEMWQRSKGY